jgi:hypothetical protein
MAHCPPQRCGGIGCSTVVVLDVIEAVLAHRQHLHKPHNGAEFNLPSTSALIL